MYITSRELIISFDKALSLKLDKSQVISNWNTLHHGIAGQVNHVPRCNGFWVLKKVLFSKSTFQLLLQKSELQFFCRV